MIRKKRGYWTKERCREEALKYTLRKDFRISSGGAYSAASRNGWLDEICSHMICKYKKKGYWTKERCWEIAIKCNTKTDFFISEPGAHKASKKNEWFDEICSHMIKPLSGIYIIYAYEFPDNYVYVGLTKNRVRRFEDHLYNKKSPVCKHTKKTKNQPNLLILYEQEIYSDSEIKKQEIFWYNYYKNNNWNMLNKLKPGTLGVCGLYWTKERCHKEALKYKTRKEFKISNGSAYEASRRYKILDSVCSHMMTRKKKKRGYWTKERCQEEALKYRSRSEFTKSNKGAYNAARRNGWLDEICSHMIFRYKKESTIN